MGLDRRSFSKALFCHLPLTLGAFSVKPGLLEAFQPRSETTLSGYRSDAVATPGQPSAAAGSALGLNTWSLRAIKSDEAIPVIVTLMKQTGMRNCQLLFSHAEPAEFDPDFAAMLSGVAPTQQERDEQKRKAEARTAWRLSVSMSYFESLRARFEREGLRIRSYGSPFGSSAEEVDRVFLIAKTMGAIAVNGRLPEAQTDIVAAAARRHGLIAGIQVTDPHILAAQLRTSPQLRADPDLGDLTKAGISALQFVKDNMESISSIDLKDAVIHGGSVAFGSGDAHMREVLEFLAHKDSTIERYIDCDYPGTGSSTDEVKRCVGYVRAAQP